MLLGIFLTVLGLLIIYFSLVIKIVRPPYEWVVELWGGKKIKKWKSGINFLWIPIPIFMKVANKLFCADQVITLQIGSDEGEGSPGKIDFTDASAAVRVQIILRVINPIKATYEVDDYREASINRVESELRKYLGGKTLDKAMVEEVKENIAKKVFRNVNEAISEWGVNLTNPDEEIAIIDFELDEETEKIRREILSAEKKKQVIVTTAEGVKQEQILHAEGKKQESILHAEGETQAEWWKIKTIAEELALNNDQVLAYLLTGKLYDAMEASTIISTSEGGTLNAPVNVAATMSALQSAMTRSDGGSLNE